MRSVDRSATEAEHRRHVPIRALASFLVLAFLGLAVEAAFDPAEQMQFADGLYARKLYDMAIQEYLVLAREAPDFPQIDAVFYRIGEGYRRLGQKQSAERFYQRLLNTFPESAFRFKTEFRHAELFVSEGTFLEAINLFRVLLGKKPPPEIAASAQYYLGYCQKRIALAREAEQAFRVVLDKYPESPFVAYACIELAGLYKAEKRDEQAILDLYRRAAEQSASPRAAAEALFQRAELAFAHGDYEQSAIAYKELIDQYPGDTRIVEARLQAAWSFYHTEHFERVLLLIGELMEGTQQEKQAEVLYLKANTERQMKREADALETYAGLMQAYPDHTLTGAAIYERTLILFQRNQYDEVIQALGGRSVSETVQHDAYWLLAESYAAKGDVAQAAEHYRKIMGAASSDRAPQAAYQLGRLFQGQGQFEEAVKEYQDLAARFPKNDLAPRALFAVSYCLVRLDRKQQAIVNWSVLLDNYPEHELAEEALYRKALAEIEIKQYESAQASLESFIGTYPKSEFLGEGHYWLGVLAEENGKPEDAEARFRKAMETGTNEELILKTQYRLATSLQKQGKLEEAADLVQGLVDMPEAKKVPESLLEWLSTYRFEEKDWVSAQEAASRLVTSSQSSAWRQIGWYIQGKSLEQLEKVKEAEEAYKQALAQDARTREGAESALKLGTLSLRANQLEAARNYMEQAGDWAADPELADIRARCYHGLGEIAERDSQWEDAARYYMSVAVLFDDPQLTPEALFKASGIFARLGKQIERRKAIVELLERYPESAWADKAKGDSDPESP